MARNFSIPAAFILLFGVISCSRNTPDAPVLILATNADFGTYTAEILKTEGFNEFELDSLSGGKISASYLARFDLVILAESKIGSHGKRTIYKFVKKGGNLIAFCPDPELAGLFGILPESGMITGGYIAIDTTAEPGRGLTSKKIRYHGNADRYSLNGGNKIATLFAGKSDNEGLPAIVSHDYGKGHAVAFLYNLPKNIVYTRQGNPLFAGIEKDSIPGLRGMDLFTDGWVDTSANTINPADEQMVLLSHCIERMNKHTKPLPRFWYFPDALKCLVTLTNDGEYKGEADFEPQFRDVDSMGAKMSIYILETDKVSREWVDKWTAKGFEISGHPDEIKEAGNPVWNHMDSALSMRNNEIALKYGLTMHTNVNHWFVWCGRDSGGTQNFAAQARLEEKNGIGMDINYAHYDMKSNQGDHYLGPLGTNQGNYTGSGLVMKFADVRGGIIDVYQHLNAVYDQEYTESHDPEGFYNCFKGLMDRSLFNEVYSFISIKAHNDEYYFSKTPLMRMLAYANYHEIPVWTALKLLDFLKMKDEASFTGIRWSNNQLLFNLNSSLKHTHGLTFMIPLHFGDQRIIGITKNGQESPFSVSRIKGSEYALTTVQPGENYTFVVNYGN